LEEKESLDVRSRLSFSPDQRLATIAVAATTPPATRKRKALEAAIEDDESSITTGSSINKVCKTSARQCPSLVPTPAGVNFPTSLRNRVLDIATPATTAETMDSDDEFMTDASSPEDNLGTQGSDDESLGEGQLTDCPSHPVPLPPSRTITDVDPQ
jgi:hypothetical protein